MSPARKLPMFEMLVADGLQGDRGRLPVGHRRPTSTSSASSIEEDRIPDDVTIQVLTQAREDLIERTVRVAGRGAPRHRAPLQRAPPRCSGASCSASTEDEIKSTSRSRGTELRHEVRRGDLGRLRLRLRVLARDLHRHRARLRASRSARRSSTCGSRRPDRKIILNLPATVEMSTPNVYADQIEWMQPQPRRGASTIVLSVHPHNDRGTARGRRRTGADGRRRPRRGLPVRQRRAHRQRRPGHARAEPVHPGRRPGARLLRHRRDPAHASSTATSCRCTRATRTPATWSTPRSPARTRTRSRRASTRCATRQAVDDIWDVPYLPIDPKDLGRSYEAVIRVNSQSGKGGVAYLLKTEHGLDLPRRLQIEFSPRRPGAHRRRGRRDHARPDLGDLPGRVPHRRPASGSARATASCRRVDEKDAINVDVRRRRRDPEIEGVGNGPIAAFIDALGGDRHRRARAGLPRARAVARAATPRPRPTSSARSATEVLWGVGVDANTVTASLKAVLSAVNRGGR